MSAHPGRQGLVIVGAGPAGLAPLFAAASAGRLREVLEAGVTILERGTTVGAGALGGYNIDSDSAADALLDIVTRSREPRLRALREHPTTQTVAQCGKGAAPLQAVGAFLSLAGNVIGELVAASPRGRVLCNANAVWVQQSGAGTWRTRYRDGAQQEREVDSGSVLLATGAYQPLDRLWNEPVAGRPLLPGFGDKLVQSGDIFNRHGFNRAVGRLKGKAFPRVAIVGGSTSAAAVADVLLQRMPAGTFGPASVTLLHRNPLRIFYESAAEAQHEGYTEFTPADVCDLTGRVYRFSGFRASSRELMMRARGIGNRPLEERLQLFLLHRETHEEARALMDRADLVVAAMGYRPRLLPVFDEKRQVVELISPAQQWSAVDDNLRVLDSNGAPLQGLFAMGLAVGPRAHAGLGGEAGFTGQINSLWMWQHNLGEVLMKQVLSRVQSSAADVSTTRSVDRTTGVALAGAA